MRVLFFVALLTAVDQLTKYWAVVHLKPIGSVAIVPGFFSLTYVENRGAAWGMLAGRHVFLIGFSLLTLAFLCWRRRQLFDHLWGGRVTFTLLVGGILGNLIDRIRLNYVVDFLDFFWGHHHFPAFNVADSAICCGVFLFILTQWIHDRKHGHRH
ncbi:MAG: signal peptidase II [Kiritimatiellae bacterium]|jgi:signal peptidase II|nr:signal peptidase II [Kiritimatiellia bacterium]MDD3583430.1 signal peptidase II [Kiritimatiellia bacterium]HON46867.1 signal peptidase II [Kiritimatiellia bacterium]